MSELLLNKEEMRLLEQMAIDSETGNHLLYPRSEEYHKMAQKFTVAQAKADNVRSVKECQMIEYFVACKDFNEYRNFCAKYGINQEEPNCSAAMNDQIEFVHQPEDDQENE